MMNVRKVRMTVAQRRVFMFVAVGFAAVPFKWMLVLMMLVVHMPMAVLEWIVPVLVAVVFPQVNPHAKAHQQGGGPERQRHRFTEQQDGNCRAEERRRGKVRAGPGSAEPTQCQHEQHQLMP